MNPDVIRAHHITDIRDAIRDLWLIKDLSDDADEFPDFANNEPANLTALFASQTSDPRLWLNQAANVPSIQGVGTLSYHPPTYGGNAYVSQEWAGDIKGLHDTDDNKRVKAVRYVLRKGAAQSPTQHDIGVISGDCATYRSTGSIHPSYDVYALMHKETFDNNSDHNQAIHTINGIDYTNSYIEGFSEAMASLMKTLYDGSGNVSKFIIWNEPNNYEQPSKKLELDRFAALLRRTWVTSLDQFGSLMSNNTVKLYW